MSSQVQEVLPSLYRIEVPLPGSPLKALNSYVVKGGDRTLVIDTGWNREECITTMRLGLEALGVSLQQVDFFVTHYHADHWGMIGELTSDTAKVYASQHDAGVMATSDPGYWDRALTYALRHGFPQQELEAALGRHPGRRYVSRKPLAFSTLKEGDTIAIAGYSFRCVETPGHTRGHMCLYEPDRKLLVSGDHVLGDITPNISLWADGLNPLGDFLASLRKVSALDIELALPAHRSPIAKPRERIGQLLHHHEARLAEVVAILGKGPQSAYQVAGQMTWDIGHRSWSDFPPGQKWFAVGEAMAHLRLLEEEGRVRRETQAQMVLFSLV